MFEEKLLKTAIQMVPHWYEAECAPNRYSLCLSQMSLPFCTHRPLTPHLGDFKRRVEAVLPGIASAFATAPPPSLDGLVQEALAIEWLRIVRPSVAWQEALTYFKSLENRTYENQRVSLNLILTDGEGQFSISDPGIQKVLDQLAGSPFTYIQVDRNLRYLDYHEIRWSQVVDSSSYKFHPEFLHPFHCVMGEQDLSIHLTGGGDLLILNKEGLLAAKRKGFWKIYDVRTFKNTLADVLIWYRVACNLFEVIFDLSFKRHGALLVFDPDDNVIQHVANKESILNSTRGGNPDQVRSMLAPKAAEIQLGHREPLHVKKRLLMELASIDGAVIFNQSGILAFGAIIEPHASVQGVSGARTTAALLAFRWGGQPIKISSDGEITVYFKSSDPQTQNSCNARLDFL